MIVRMTALSLAVTLLVLTGCSSAPAQKIATVAAAPTIDVKTSYQHVLQSMQSGQWQAAREQLTVITTQQPSLSGPWVNLGITETMLGDAASAEAAFKTAIDTNSKNFEAYNQLGMLYRRDGRLDEAQFIYEEALRQDPDNASIHWNLAILFDRYLPNPNKALEHYQRYQQLTGSDDRQLQAWIGELNTRTGGKNMTARVKP